MIQHDDSGHPGTRPATTVRTGPGVAADAITYVTRRLLGLSRYAPRPIDAIDATVTRPHDRTRSHTVEVRATLTLGRRVLRVRQTATDLRTATDQVYDRLQRRLGDLPHGSRGDYVPHRKARQSEVNDPHPGGIEDDRGIPDVPESHDGPADEDGRRG